MNEILIKIIWKYVNEVLKGKIKEKEIKKIEIVDTCIYLITDDFSYIWNNFKIIYWMSNKINELEEKKRFDYIDKLNLILYFIFNKIKNFLYVKRKMGKENS